MHLGDQRGLAVEFELATDHPVDPDVDRLAVQVAVPIEDECLEQGLEAVAERRPDPDADRRGQPVDVTGVDAVLEGRISLVRAARFQSGSPAPGPDGRRE